MIPKETIDIVRERLELIKQLTYVREFFRSGPLIKEVGDARTHSFRHYSALRIYLALTCFDILGQQHEWVDFTTWLKSSRTKAERDVIFSKHTYKSTVEQHIAVHEEYTRIYGVKNSFYRFMRETISEESRNKLMGSIRVGKKDKSLPSTRLALPINIDVNTDFKEKFLYKIRNSFTHKGISYGDYAAVIFKNSLGDIPLRNGDGSWMWPFKEIFEEEKGGDHLIYRVAGWPFILIEIIEDVISKAND